MKRKIKNNFIFSSILVSILFLLVLSPQVSADECAGLNYTNCLNIDVCRVANLQTYNKYISFYDCWYQEPECDPGSILLSEEYDVFDNLCCDSDGNGECEYLYTTNGPVISNITCLSAFDCFSNCGTDQIPCVAQGVCVNYLSDNNNCGSCGNVCPQGTTCQSGNCVFQYMPVCGNGIIDPGEECEKEKWCGGIYGGDRCNNNNDCVGSLFGENCMLGEIGVSCDPPYGGSCTYCSFLCNNITIYGGYCGDGVCNDLDETISNCFRDCGSIPGWNSIDNGWSVNEEKRLIGTASNTDINIYSDTFDVYANRNYTLSGEIYIVSGDCQNVFIDINDGRCLSSNDFNIKNCFENKKLLSTGQINTKIQPFNNNYASNGLLKNVSIRIHVPAGCTAKFDNIYFIENSEINAYQPLQPTIQSSSGCCPDNYCWDGSECVIADYWNASNKSNIWSPLNIDSLLNKHLNSSLKWLSRGYRCSVDDSGLANWVPAEIKYDWNYEQSGYCIRESDCFVNHSFINYENGGSSCIKDGEVISEAFDLGKGGHYCYNGTWTTKTSLIANLLENITSGKPYVLFCDVTGRIFNSNISTEFTSDGMSTRISGGCVLLLKENDAEKIITGFYLEDPSYYPACDLYKNVYFMRYKTYPDCSASIGGISSCTELSGSYLRCVDLSEENFVLYYNNESKYWIVSNDNIQEIEQNLFYVIWNSIKRFFQKLFGYTPNQPLGLASQTTNFEKIYILSNNTIKVSALEEKKYDEELVKQMVYMYLNMSGQNINSEDNKFNIEFINSTLGGVYYTHSVLQDNNLLIIKYSRPAELWPYITAMIRDRP
ncbi:MAG: hypothetical protein KatS3mg002_0583 [Candidatus Woesearchaeota archaeon]|nr:MAG: hypothetical protein KatS3mg002_0583 [Candidatus Woesearchaeota archaeon]